MRRIQYGCKKVLLTGNIGDEVEMTLRYFCQQANSLYNQVLFDVRQSHFESCELYGYFDKNDFYRCGRKDKKVKVSYPELCKKYKVLPQYKALGSNAGQQVLKSLVEACIAYNKLLPMWFRGELRARPRLPNYRDREGLYQLAYPAVFVKYDKYEGTCKLPLSRESKPDYFHEDLFIPIAAGIDDEQVVEVRIVPQANKLWAEYVYKEPELIATTLDKDQYLAIDPGIDNWATCVTTKGKSFIIDGHKVKASNALYNKRVAQYKVGKPQKYWDEQLNEWTHRRNCFMRDVINKSARFLVNYCLTHGIGNIVFGWGQGVKDGVNIGKVNNQNFVQIPTARLKERVKQLASSVGINFVETEESYTSKTSFIDRDFLPVYGGEKPANWKPSGKRVKRGLYRTANGQLINADCNGAANILRKVTAQLGVLAESGLGALTHPKRYSVFSNLDKLYRKRCAACLKTA